MKRILLTAACLLWASTAGAQVYAAYPPAMVEMRPESPGVSGAVRVAQAVYVASQFSDFASTKWAMAHGAREGNPIWQAGDGSRLAGKVAVSLLVVAITSHAAKTTPTAMRVVLYSLSAVNLAVSAHNVRIGFTVQPR